MGRLMYLLYRIIFVPFFMIGFITGSIINKKMRDGLKGRKNNIKKIREFLASPSREKRLLYHCSSVGECEQAIPIIEKIKKYDQNIKIIVSYFSPSGFKFLKNHPDIDLKIYLPFDLKYNAKRLFKLLKPDIWLISAYDIWPNHVMVACKLDIPVVLTSATLAEDSLRYKGLNRIFNRFVYRRIDFIFPRSLDDYYRFLTVFPYQDKMEVTGDSRFDRVYEKAMALESKERPRIFREINEDDLLFIAGSIWPEDEDNFLSALLNILAKFQQLKVILVPHELHERHIRSIQDCIESKGFESERYSMLRKDEGTSQRVVIIDTIGMLAKLYMITHVAYVGGSFGKGVHNVMEPAVFGQPVLFGPRHVNSQEAIELVKIGGGFCITNNEGFENRMNEILSRDDFREKAGQIARNYVIEKTGATNKCFQIIKDKYLIKM